MVDEGPAISVTARDPSWGNPLAPVTIVVFSDFQCPFCSRVGRTMEELRRIYGAEQIRIVWKNYPLPFHDRARSAAIAAMTVFQLGGAQAFWKFHDLVFGHQRELDPERYRTWAEQAGAGGDAFVSAFATNAQSAKVDEDVALAKRLGIRGTPVFRINGIAVMGAQPLAAFIEVIDPQLMLAQQLLSAGTPAADLYALLSARNAAAEREATAQALDANDAAVWRVPVGKSDPVRGADDALVTLVVFSDFECPFCKRFADSVRILEAKYGSDLRIVWKDLPLPFHQRARPAAALARFAFDRKGAGAFWKAHDALFEAQENLADASLKHLAGRLGLSWQEAKSMDADRRFENALHESVQLAKYLNVRGTPCSFVNGVRMEGALPTEQMVALIDEQLAKARALAAERGSRTGLYEAITRSAEDAGGSRSRVPADR